jgi:hypothetical protein
VIACFPKRIPADFGAGCLVSRVLVPETPFEKNYAVTWRVTLWIEGRMYLGGQASAEPPTLAGCLESQRLMPVCWPELVRHN